MANSLENKPEIKLCSVLLNDFTKIPLVKKMHSLPEGSDRRAEVGRNGPKTHHPNVTVRNLTAPRQETLHKIQRPIMKDHTVAKVNKKKQISTEDNNVSNMLAGSESSRPDSSMSCSSSSFVSSDTSEEDMFVPIPASELKNQPTRKRTYDQAISDDEDNHFVPVSNTSEDSDSAGHVATESDYSTEEESLNQDEFLVEKIVGSKLKGGKKFYFVKWQGYSSDQNTWEPESNLASCRDLINEYVRQCKLARAQASVAKKNRQAQAGPNKSISNTRGVLNATAVPTVKDVEYNLGETFKPNSKDVTASHAQSNEVLNFQNPSEVVPETIIIVEGLETLNTATHFILRVWENDGMYLLPIDISKKVQGDRCYNLIITEHIRNRTPEWIYGACLDIDGHVYCLVKFKGFEYIDIVTPRTLLQRYPYLAHFYNVSKYRKEIIQSLKM